MQLFFQGDIEELQSGIDVLAKDLGIQLNQQGLKVEVVKVDEPTLEVSKTDDGAIIQFSRNIYFFRAFGLLVETLQNGEEHFSIKEEPQFDLIGPMFDVSQGNAAVRVDRFKLMIRKMALMGLGTFMLYGEDSYVVEEQPYFGYMRSKYTPEEMKELDDYAWQFGIEIIPFMQTLGHLRDVLQWPAFNDIKDNPDNLMVGEERTYEFVEQMIVASTKPLRSKRIHLGLDEVWNLGLGKYLPKNGYRSKFDLMNEHIERVLEITKKHGLEPIMWSDMYFRAFSKDGHDYYDLETHIPDEAIAKMPKGIQQVFWNYHTLEEDFYAEMMRKHKRIDSDPMMATGIWNWHGFTVNYGKSFAAGNAALTACKKEGINNIIATTWGASVPECNIFAIMLGLQFYAEHNFAKELDYDKLRSRFEFCTGARYDDFWDIRLVDEVPGTSKDNVDGATPSKYLTWQNILAGLLDYNIKDLPLAKHYGELRQTMEAAKERNGEFNFLFDFYAKVCDMLEIKSEIGLHITDAYQAGDKEKLKEFTVQTLPELYTRMKALRDAHVELWFDTYKPFGWEVFDHRYGAQLGGIEVAIKRINDYLNGKIERIDELEEKRLPYHGKEGLVFSRGYSKIASASAARITD